MSDIRVEVINGVGTISMNSSGTDLVGDDGLESAVLLSLYSDGLAEADEVLPDQSEDRRGFWGDAEFASLLWIMERKTLTPKNINRHKKICQDSLAWMVKSGVAKSVTVTNERVGNVSLETTIQIMKPDGVVQVYSYLRNWQAMEEQNSAT